ncbi:MAG: enoyl-CoA hydratase/isomerase family protein [Xanthomonadales bacterium]|nr:enoyl-CoA hydratase/isomerase family protein [Xanthomonadales bacterium]
MLESRAHGAILELELARPPVNALDAELIRALRAAIESAPAAGARALVLSGRPGMFSGGLDVPSLLTLDRAAMQAVWADFFALLRALAASPVPIVAAITGHSPAGGAVLSIFCDYRIMARGTFRIGLNETQVGLVVPEVIQATLRRLVGSHRAERLMVAGAMLESEQALAAGLVDELIETDLVVGRAIAWLGELLALPPEAMAETRRIARADLVALFDAPGAVDTRQFVDRWFSAEAQQVLGALVAKLRNRG